MALPAAGLAGRPSWPLLGGLVCPQRRRQLMPRMPSPQALRVWLKPRAPTKAPLVQRVTGRRWEPCAWPPATRRAPPGPCAACALPSRAESRGRRRLPPSAARR
ncbi:hypothetical protein PVAP13_9KG289513 [Panicum virgatum]|uniref:Uncharacterized protein n=1 Tax=Panicum virgatum TaxID=38727 RepID=A0A8T0NPD6_PANVG|nr:hypothetical protein PVAP13_9KG289513 [Panicum virgatum]